MQLTLLNKTMCKILPFGKLSEIINFVLRRFISLRLSVPELSARKIAFHFDFHTLQGIIKIGKITIIYVPDHI